MHRTIVAAAVLLALHASSAAAQNAGADHYEVTIAPPPRPGKEPAAQPPTPPPADADDGADASPAPGAPTATAPAPAAAASQAAKPVGPLRSLQVGAYRQRRSAEAMSEKLGDAFGDVQLVEVDSGGEKLYRVRVGRLPAGPALNDLKSRLLAAGYPAFEVEISEQR